MNFATQIDPILARSLRFLQRLLYSRVLEAWEEADAKKLRQRQADGLSLRDLVAGDYIKKRDAALIRELSKICRELSRVHPKKYKISKDGLTVCYHGCSGGKETVFWKAQCNLRTSEGRRELCDIAMRGLTNQLLREGDKTVFYRKDLDDLEILKVFNRHHNYCEGSGISKHAL